MALFPFMFDQLSLEVGWHLSIKLRVPANITVLTLSIRQDSSSWHNIASRSVQRGLEIWAGATPA